MTDPTTATNPTDPQDLIDQALGDMGTTVPTPPPTEPAAPAELPTLEPLTPTATQNKVEVSGEAVVTETPKAEESIPTELTTNQEMSSPVEADEQLNNLDMIEAKGEDVPLALVGATEPETSPITSAPVVEPINPVVPPALTGMMGEESKPKKNGKKVLGLLVGILGMFGLLSYIGYYYYGYIVEPGKISIVCDETVKWCRDPGTGSVSRNDNWSPDNPDNYNAADDAPDANVRPGEATTPEQCTGCSNGGWLVWRDGECKVTGICDSGVPGKDTENPAIEESNDADSCFRSGGTWCGNVVDTSGVSHAFCGPSNGEACYQLAIDRGITMQIGRVGCECKTKVDGICTVWGIDQATQNAILSTQTSIPTQTQEIAKVNNQCQAQAGSFTTLGNQEMWICPVGTTVACTSGVTGAKRFYGKTNGCFCGVVQIDTGSGHTSYSSTCGCNEEVQDTPNPSTPTITTNPTLMCDSISRSPSATVSLGDKVTFTCVGSSSPAGSVNLSYKFRYSINSGAYTALANKTATTAEMTVAACGSYKVQCQACGTINGTLVCDPVWSGATTQ